jgi:hypothetical protein
VPRPLFLFINLITSLCEALAEAIQGYVIIRRVPAVFDELCVLHAGREADLRVLGQHQKLGTKFAIVAGALWLTSILFIPFLSRLLNLKHF